MMIALNICVEVNMDLYGEVITTFALPLSHCEAIRYCKVKVSRMIIQMKRISDELTCRQIPNILLTILGSVITV